MRSPLFKSHPNYAGDGVIYILHFPELYELRKAMGEFHTKKITTAKKKKATLKFQIFCDWFIGYSNNLTKGKSLPIDKIADTVFSLESMKLPKFKQFLYKSLLIATDYIKYLKNEVTEKNIHKYKNSITDIYIDYEWIISNIELYYKSLGDVGDAIESATGSRKSLNTMDMLNSIGQIFYIERFNKITDLYFRDLKPLMIFQIRQLLEVLGKNIIGYEKIVDASDCEIKKFTQASWDFIKKESGKSSWSIAFPCQLSSIDKINNWANSFVHTTYFYNCYVKHFAFMLINQLFKPVQKPVKIYTGRHMQSFLFGDIRIQHYDSLKADFEKFIKEKMPAAQIYWSNIDTVHAYIESL